MTSNLPQKLYLFEARPLHLAIMMMQILYGFYEYMHKGKLNIGV